MMRFIVPINAAQEVRALAEAGAGELYCGLMEPWWAQRYGDHDSISRRQGRANLSSREELAALVAQAAEAGLPVSLALNSRYTEPQLDYLEDLCLWFEEAGGSGIIASDVGLLSRLAGKTRLPRTLSILAAAENAGTLAAFANLGATRFVLPRFSTPELAVELLQACPGMEAEAMAFFDKCHWVDGYCRHFHGVGYIDWPGGAETLPCEESDLPAIHTMCTTFREHACQRAGLASANPYSCAACHLNAFEQAGVAFAKIGGRGLPLEERLRALRFLRTAIALESDDARKDAYSKTFDSTCNCYYGDAAQVRTRIEDPGTLPSEDGRLLIGSQIDFEECLESIRIWRESQASTPQAPVTVFLPPLSQEQYKALPELIDSIAEGCPADTRICANDLGTLLLASRIISDNPDIRVVVGTLLARVDDVRELEAVTSKEANPSRIVMDPDGLPCRLEYEPPTPELVRHWRSPSLLEPTAAEAIARLIGR